MTTTVQTAAPAATESTATCTLGIGGVTCASCVRRVEKALSRLDGVAGAEVNLATEVATVQFDPQRVGLDELTAAVARAGYTATRRGDTASSGQPQGTAAAAEDDAHEALLQALKRKWQVAPSAGLGLMVLMYQPLNLDTMDWLMPAIFVVTTVIQFWAGRAFCTAACTAAWAAARHGATNMNTLVALGTGVAYGYSAFVTLWPGVAERLGLPLHVYFETSLVIIALILLGRWLEARGRVACSITARTYIRAPDRVVVSRKSQASRASAWECRNWDQVLEARSGAGSIPASFSSSHTVGAATFTPGPAAHRGGGDTPIEGSPWPDAAPERGSTARSVVVLGVWAANGRRVDGRADLGANAGPCLGVPATAACATSAAAAGAAVRGATPDPSV